jgi:biotin transport system substrate-specific component
MRNELSLDAGARLRVGAVRRGLAIAAGALVVAVAAQVTVPVPLSPVPMTLQPLAVLAVGGVLGARAGAAALVLYLTMGLIGLPVFAAGSAGIGRLLGPTGGYLLAFPVAAALTGLVAGRAPGVLGALMACAAGMVAIHVGGVAQLALLGGDPAVALRVGFVPFLTGDLLKIGLAAAVILAVGGRFRATR